MTNAIEVEGLVQVAKWISTLLLTGAAICAAVIVLRLLKKNEFKLGPLEIPLRMLAGALAALTVAHGYLTWLLKTKVDGLLKLGKPVAREAWENLVIKSDALVFNGMMPRIPQDKYSILGTIYATSIIDPTFWLNVSFAVAVIVSVVASRIPNAIPSAGSVQPVSVLNSLMLGIAIAFANWLLGSYWAIQLSGLAL